jgi:hypothetical protein
MSNLFQTSSLNIVAWLMTMNIDSIEHAKINGQSIFYYERSTELQEALNSYNNNIDLKRFISCFKKIKDIIKA